MDNIPSDIQEFNTAFYKRIKYKNDYLNCWERLITNSEQFKGLLVQFDINCLAIPSIDLNMKFIRELLKIVDEYTKERIDY